MSKRMYIVVDQTQQPRAIIHETSDVDDARAVAAKYAQHVYGRTARDVIIYAVDEGTKMSGEPAPFADTNVTRAPGSVD